MKELTNRIGSLIAGQIPGFIFKKSEGKILRSSKSGWQAIVLDVIPTASPGMGKLAAHAQVRHDKIEALYLPFHPYIDSKDARKHPTLTVNCDNLLQNKNLSHAFILNPACVDDFANDYAEAVRSDIIPWLEKFSDEQTLTLSLLDEDPGKWATSDRLVRYPVLLAIMADRGDVAGFDAVAVEFQEWCKQRHAVVYASLASAMMNMRPH